LLVLGSHRIIKYGILLLTYKINRQKLFSYILNKVLKNRVKDFSVQLVTNYEIKIEKKYF